MIQPLFPPDDTDKPDDSQAASYASRHRKGLTINPVSKDLLPASPISRPAAHSAGGGNPAAEIIRHKLEAIYSDEPAAKQEMSTVVMPRPQRSKHQEFMYELSTSGKPLAQIQTEWHAYYVGLPDDEKHQVWREFYEANAKNPSAYAQHMRQKEEQAKHIPATGIGHAAMHYELPQRSLPELPPANRASAEEIHKKIVNRVTASGNSQSRAKRHLHSLAFGLGTGLLVLFILLFGLFNEVILAPFMQPSRHVSATPIIVNSDSIAASDIPEVVIPKINVQIPVVYGLVSSEESLIQDALEDGVIHYPSTSLPGQQGNAAFFGHSSNNIFNKGKYKFAFVLLSKLAPGDTFYLTYEKRIYAYRVFDTRIVSPKEVSVLGSVPGKAATVTLITCDPPGTSTNRLVVWGEQISPDPSTAIAPITPAADAPAALPSDGPSFWQRLLNWDF